jgi:acyl-CoA hydrolase
VTASAVELGSAAGAVDRLRPGQTVYVPGVSGESLPFYEALCSDADHARGVTFVGAHFPGINRSDYLGLHPTARQRAYFMSPAVRAALPSGRVDLMPLDYPGIVRDLENDISIDVALAQVAPPDASGRCALGVSYDFLPSVWHKAGIRIAHVNPLLPKTRGSFGVRLEDCEARFECPAAVPTLRGETADEATRRHAKHVAGLVRDGDTLQFGVGRLQGAILEALAGHRRLRIYSGMISSPVARLVDGGVIAGEAAVEAGVALGDATFYERVGRDATFYFRPVRETHDVRRIAAIPNFCAINSALSVDLWGQVNAESIEGRMIAGSGGLPAFSSGARLAAGGRSVITLSATADGGRASRIVAQLPAGAIISVPRHETDCVVTEYGSAELRGLSLQARARALIGIAAPQFREPLTVQWHEMEKTL